MADQDSASGATRVGGPAHWWRRPEWWKQRRVWVSAVGTSVLVGVLVPLVNHLLSPAPKPALVTAVHLVQPFDTNGTLLPPYRAASMLSEGRCSPGHASSDPSAWSCMVGDGIFDPCWASGATQVVCLSAPWDPDVVVINQVTMDYTAPAPTGMGTVPWALQIVDPHHPSRRLNCSHTTSTINVPGREVVHWACSEGTAKSAPLVGYGLGEPTIPNNGAWSIDYRPVDSSETVSAQVTQVWR